MVTRASPRRFLFLQGITTLFFARLGRQLDALGHTVHRINFTAGDRLFWSLPGSVDWRGRPEEWPAFIEKCLNEWRITDVILFGDWRPLHVEAIRIASARGLAVHVFEEGYLRPDWITLDRGGVNANSTLPRDPDWYRQQAATLPAWREAQSVPGSFLRRAVMDVTYHWCSLLLSWRFPHYQSHLPLNPFREYWGWMGRFLRRGRHARQGAQTLAALSASGKPFFLYPLQLDTDSQLRIHSSFGGQAPAMDMVLESFARHAPQDTLLLLKEHPLDPQLEDWEGRAKSLAAKLGIADRMFYLRGGDILRLSSECRGMVTVNSTCGVLALHHGVPVMALAQPIYAMPGLTFQNGLDRFWGEAPAPDAVLFDAFRRVIARKTQINGNFYSEKGVAMAVQGACDRMVGLTSARPALAAAVEHYGVPAEAPRLAAGEAN